MKQKYRINMNVFLWLSNFFRVKKLWYFNIANSWQIYSSICSFSSILLKCIVPIIFFHRNNANMKLIKAAIWFELVWALFLPNFPTQHNVVLYNHGIRPCSVTDRKRVLNGQKECVLTLLILNDAVPFRVSTALSSTTLVSFRLMLWVEMMNNHQKFILSMNLIESVKTTSMLNEGTEVLYRK